jgi:hypothetical protein
MEKKQASQTKRQNEFRTEAATQKKESIWGKKLRLKGNT